MPVAQTYSFFERKALSGETAKIVHELFSNVLVKLLTAPPNYAPLTVLRTAHLD